MNDISSSVCLSPCDHVEEIVDPTCNHEMSTAASSEETTSPVLSSDNDRINGSNSDFFRDVPDGALHIVKHIAATHLMQHLIGCRQTSIEGNHGDTCFGSAVRSASSSSWLSAVKPSDSSNFTKCHSATTAPRPLPSVSSSTQQLPPPSVLLAAKDKSFPYQRVIDFDALLEVVKQCPTVCRELFIFIGKDGQTRNLHPLALICTLKPNLELVRTVYDAYPHAVSAKEPFRGSLPLHYAAAYEAPLEVLEFLVSKHRPGLNVRLTENISPLDLACYHFHEETASSKNINFLLNECPEAAGECCTEQNWYPLHSALSSGASLDSVIRPLYKIYPDAISLLGRGSMSPLHIAAKQKNYGRVTEFIAVNTPPNLLALEDHEGHAPLAYAAMHQTARVIAVLVGRTPPAESQRRHLGWKLLHLAAVYNDNGETDAVTYLAKRFPDQLTSVTSHCGSTPLHLACRKGAPLDNIKTLARLNCDVLHMTDGFGKTPYDLAVRRYGSNHAVVCFLRDYEANPMAQF